MRGLELVLPIYRPRKTKGVPREIPQRHQPMARVMQTSQGPDITFNAAGSALFDETTYVKVFVHPQRGWIALRTVSAWHEHAYRLRAHRYYYRIGCKRLSEEYGIEYETEFQPIVPLDDGTGYAFRLVRSER